MPVEANLRAAMAHHQGGRLEKAADLYRQVLDAQPEHSDALQLYGLLRQQMGDLDTAERLMRKSLAVAPGQPHVHNNLGNLLMALERVREAVDHYRKATGLKPDYAEAWHNLGLALTATGELEAAIEALARATAARPDYYQAYNSLGNAHQNRKDFDAAIAAYRKALDIRPDYVKAMHNLAVSLRRAGQLEEAVACFREVIRMSPEIAEAHYNLGHALQLLERVDEAEAAYNRALELKPDFEEAHYDVNQLLWMNGRRDRFLQSYPQAIRRQPDSLDLWVNYAEKLILATAFEAAEKTLRDAIDRFGPMARLYDLLARTLASQRRETDALPCHQTCLELDESEPRYFLHYADTLLRLREYRAALEIMTNARRLDPLDQELIAYEADCWGFLGDPRYDYVNDYEKMVRVFELPLPDGYRDIASFTRDLNEALTPLHSPTRRHPLDQTVRGGSQSYEGLFDKNIELVELYKQSLRKVLAEYIADLDNDPDHPLHSRRCDRVKFSGSFTVRLRNGGWHTNHVHPAGWLSSCFYVSLPPVVAGSNRHEGWIHFGQPGARFDPPLEPRRYVQPEEGVVAIFPSYMWHGTVPFKSDHTRTTVVSDIVPDP